VGLKKTRKGRNDRESGVHTYVLGPLNSLHVYSIFLDLSH